jgi:hypothetical protein
VDELQILRGELDVDQPPAAVSRSCAAYGANRFGDGVAERCITGDRRAASSARCRGVAPSSTSRGFSRRKYGSVATLISR